MPVQRSGMRMSAGAPKGIEKKQEESMEDSMYTEQLLMQQSVHWISAILAVSFFCAAGILLFLSYRRGERRYGIWTVLTMVLLLGVTGLEQAYAAPVAAKGLPAPITGVEKNEVEFRITQGQESSGGQTTGEQTTGEQMAGEKNYIGPVRLEVFWRSSGTQEEAQELRIEFSGEKYAESLSLDPGYGTSVKEQLEYLGISWITCVSESGIAETAEGKRIEFQVEEEGAYRIEGAGKLLAFSIGDRTHKDPSEAAEEEKNPSASEGVADTGNAGTDGREEQEKPADNKEEKEPEEMVKDEEAPSLTVSLAPSSAGGTLFSASESPILSIQAEDTKSGIADITCQMENLTTGEVREKRLHASEVKSWTSELQLDQKELGEGQIQVRIRATDFAGNSSPWESVRLEIDKTAPIIQIQGVQNTGAYAKAVTPVIKVSDSSFSLADFQYSLKGARSGWLDPSLMSDVVLTKSGIAVTMNHFPNETDDVYTLSVQAEDQAGNRSEKEVVFAMDQGGSSYIFSDATKELVQEYYTQEPVELVLSEINTSPISYAITVSKDGVPRDLREDKDYRVEVRGGDGDWLIYTYHIFASNFEEEGVYHVDVMSRDQASNVNNSQARGARIDFVVQYDGETKKLKEKEESRDTDQKKLSGEKSKKRGTVDEEQEKTQTDSVAESKGQQDAAEGEAAEYGESHSSFPVVCGVMGVVLILAVLAVCFFLTKKTPAAKGDE